MTHGFSSTDKSKKPMNMFYDFSDGKVYAYDSNEQLQEVSIGGGGSMKLNYSNAIEHNYTGAQTDTSFTSRTNGMLFYSMIKPTKLTVNNKSIIVSSYGSSGAGGTLITNSLPISSGDRVVFSCYGDANQGSLFTEVPYAD